LLFSILLSFTTSILEFIAKTKSDKEN
jgi:hypothetical protein